SWDVIVVGGGPAGCAAATSAAREGAKTLLVEGTGSLGGMGTSGLVPWFCGYTDGEKVIAKGLAEDVRTTLIENIPSYKESLAINPLSAPPIDPELLKRIYDDMTTGAGVEILFHTQLSTVEKSSDNEIDAIIVSNKSGLTALKAKVYIDCTGDGDLAVWAGAEFEKGDENGGMQPATHCFVIGNIDEEELAKGPRVHFYDPDSPIWKALRSDKYPLIEELHSCSMKFAPKTFGFNTGHVYDVDNTDPVNVSKALVIGRQMAGQYHAAFKEYLPAFVDSVLLATGSLLGVRETRRIIGNYIATLDDYLAHRSFPDEICRSAYNIDVHHASKEEVLKLTKLSIPELQEYNRKYTQPLDPGESFGVPYRCLIPKGLNNMLVAGRCISTDRRTNGSVRIMACCLNTGEAAGIAAAMAAAQSCDVREVDTEALRSTLKKHGAYLPE
ncbi:MAG: FAD-dependent oxidoreductase, partial [Victivallales bacterium]|nr:FAD-dependent oxidoreductase [Victivallales bacterium]